MAIAPTHFLRCRVVIPLSTTVEISKNQSNPISVLFRLGQFSSRPISVEFKNFQKECPQQLPRLGLFRTEETTPLNRCALFPPTEMAMTRKKWTKMKREKKVKVRRVTKFFTAPSQVVLRSSVQGGPSPVTHVRTPARDLSSATFAPRNLCKSVR